MYKLWKICASITAYGLLIGQCFNREVKLSEMLKDEAYLIKKDNVCLVCKKSIIVEEHRFMHLPKLLFLAVEDSSGENADGSAVKVNRSFELCGNIYDLYAKSVGIRTDERRKLKERDESSRNEEKRIQN